MRLFKVFHAVKSGSPEEKVAFWKLCKTAANAKPEPVALGLTKIALNIWADAYESGMNPGADRVTREAFAGSFGSAAAAEQEFDKWASDGVISEDEHTKLSTWLAEGAVNDLVEMTKTASPGMSLLKNPRIMGAIAGTAIGAGLGAWKDDDNRARGAILGAVPGAIAGAAIGHGVGEYGASRAAMQAAQAFKTEAARGHGQAASDAYERVAGLWSDSAIQDFVKNNATRIAEHHAAGHNHLPEFMHAVLPDGHSRNVFMQAVQRFLPKTPKTASLQAKLADIMQGLDQGGQPPMNADMPPSAPQGAPEGEAIASPDQGQAEAMEGVDRAHKVVDNMIFLAKQVQLPQLAQELEQNREQIANHFADGNAYLPPELQHHFAQSEHAEAFMKKYKQRFGAVSGGQKKTAFFGFGKNPPVPPTSAETKPAWTLAQFEKHLQKSDPKIRLARSTYDPEIINYIEEHPVHGLVVGGYPAHILEEVAQNPEAYTGYTPKAEDSHPLDYYGVKNFKYKTAGIMENVHQKIDSLRGLAPGGIDMEELRKYVPDAQYAGMVETSSGKRQPGFVSQQMGMTRTWDPAVVRDMRSADPKGFYRSLVGGAFPARAPTILQQALEAQKTASAQDAWLSWRTHR
jgi:hypothetical protein